MEENKRDENKNNEDINPNNEANMLRLALEQLMGLIRTWVTAKYKHDNTGLLIFSILVSFILGTIIILSYMEVLKENSVVAILGSLIGYALGKFNNSNGSDKK